MSEEIDEDDLPILANLEHWASRQSLEKAFSASSIIQRDQHLRLLRSQIVVLLLLISVGGAIALIPKSSRNPSSLVNNPPQLPRSQEDDTRRLKSSIYIKADQSLSLEAILDEHESMSSKQQELLELRATILDFERTAIRNQLILTQSARLVSTP